MTEKRKTKRELIEWILLLSIVGIVYFGGWHTEVIGKVQQVVLSTGILSPQEVSTHEVASYDLLLEDMSGKQKELRDFENEVVFMNYWATWCPPCIAEMPDINNLYHEMKDSVSFVMISLDENEDKARDFIDRKKFDFPVYFLRSSVPNTYDIHSIPTTYVLSREGTIKYEVHGMSKYNTKKFRMTLSDLSKMQQPIGDPR